jgi:hypothetical protein
MRAEGTPVMRWQPFSPAMRVARWLRWYWPGRNPLRRRCDRTEAAVLGALLVTFAVTGPLTALAATHWAYGNAMESRHAALASGHQVPAVLLTAATVAPASFVPMARAAWTTPDGARRTGAVSLAAGTPAGTKIQVWLDASGRPIDPPLDPAQAQAQAAFTGVLAVIFLAMLLWAAGLGVHCAVDRRRMAAWGDEWRATGPKWSPYR